MNPFDINNAASKYVLAFAFTPDLKQVALIRKEKPAWQAGKINGIGGKVEPEEAWTTAMTREFKEETGVYVLQEQWLEFAVLFGRKEAMPGARGLGDSWAVKCFCVMNEDISKVKTMETEPVGLYLTRYALAVSQVLRQTLKTTHANFDSYPHMRNLDYLIPMAILRLSNLKHCFVAEIEEWVK